MKHVGIPGPGGSLGQCAVCGKSFVTETLLNKAPESFTMTAFPRQMLYCHDKCKPPLQAAMKANDYKVLPDGPIRQVFAKTDTANGKDECSDEGEAKHD